MWKRVFNFEIKKLIPSINILGIDYSKYAILNAKKEIKKI